MNREGNYRIGVLTLSDQGARGQREDQSGAVIRSLVADLGSVVCYTVLPDDRGKIVALLVDWSDSEGLDLILTTGGTGFSPRDVTPEATAEVIQRPAPGLAEAVRTASFARTPHALLSRGVAGIRGRPLIVNLPGSPRGVRENLEVILPALPHGLARLAGDPADCARPAAEE